MGRSHWERPMLSGEGVRVNRSIPVVLLRCPGAPAERSPAYADVRDPSPDDRGEHAAHMKSCSMMWPECVGSSQQWQRLKARGSRVEMKCERKTRRRVKEAACPR